MLWAGERGGEGGVEERTALSLVRGQHINSFNMHPVYTSKSGEPGPDLGCYFMFTKKWNEIMFVCFFNLHAENYFFKILLFSRGILESIVISNFSVNTANINIPTFLF